jgi:cell division protein FtsB
MKKFLRKFLKRLFILGFILSILANLIIALVLIYKNNELVNTLNLYNQAKIQIENVSSGLSTTSEESKTQIDNLNKEVADLKKQNEDLKDQVSKTEAVISGKISGQILLGEGNLSQYQLVCAQDATNTNLVYCKSVSSISQTFNLFVPAGRYTVYSKALNKKGEVVLPEFTGKFTEYVQCVNSKPAEQCDEALSKKVLEVEVKSAQKASNINPVDWN